MIRDKKNKDGSGTIELWSYDGTRKLGSYKYSKKSTRADAINKSKKREKKLRDLNVWIGKTINLFPCLYKNIKIERIGD